MKRIFIIFIIFLSCFISHSAKAQGPSTTPNIYFFHFYVDADYHSYDDVILQIEVITTLTAVPQYSIFNFTFSGEVYGDTTYYEGDIIGGPLVFHNITSGLYFCEVQSLNVGFNIYWEDGVIYEHEEMYEENGQRKKRKTYKVIIYCAEIILLRTQNYDYNIPLLEPIQLRHL